MPDRQHPGRPQNNECLNAHLILCSTIDTARSFLNIFNNVYQARGGRGAPTDEEMDLLRAMLTFACSGLDSMVKQLIEDALPTIIDRYDGAAEIFKKFIERKLKSGDTRSHKFLAGIIGDLEPRKQLVSQLVKDLTSGSLQSTEEVVRVCAHFDIPSDQVVPNNLQEIFKARNEISHEMDIDFMQPNRNRRPRRREETAQLVTGVLDLLSAFLAEVDRKIAVAGN